MELSHSTPTFTSPQTLESKHKDHDHTGNSLQATLHNREDTRNIFLIRLE